MGVACGSLARVTASEVCVQTSVAPLSPRWSPVDHRLHSLAVPGRGGVAKGREEMQCCRKNRKNKKKPTKLLAEGTMRLELIV